MVRQCERKTANRRWEKASLWSEGSTKWPSGFRVAGWPACREWNYVRKVTMKAVSPEVVVSRPSAQLEAAFLMEADGF